jgi:hypothetical protein
MYQKCPGDRGAPSAHRRLKGFRRCGEGNSGAGIAPAALVAGGEKASAAAMPSAVAPKNRPRERKLEFEGLYCSEPRARMMVCDAADRFMVRRVIEGQIR